MKTIGIIAIILGAVFIFASIISGILFSVEFSGQEWTKVNIDKKMTVDSSTVKGIDVEVFSGNVDIIPSQGNNIDVELQGYIKTKDDSVPELVVFQENDVLYVEVEGLETNNLFSFINADINLLVKLPSEKIFDLNLDVGSGNVNVGEILLEGCNVTTGSGMIEVYTVRNNGCILTTSSGSIEAENLNGHNIVKTLSGSIDVEGLSGSISANTASGSIDLDYMKVEGNSYVEASSGSIDIETPPISNFKFTGDVSSGSISTNGLEIISNQRKHVDAIKGNGEYLIIANTASGSISIS